MLKRKVLLNTYKQSPLLPPVEDVLRLMGQSGNISEITLELANKLKKPLPVDRKTLTISKKKPIKVNTYRKILRFLIENFPKIETTESTLAFFNLDFRKLARKASKLPGNSGYWELYLWGYEKAGPSRFPKTKSFIRERCAEEISLFEEAGQSINKAETILKCYCRVTLLEEKWINEAFNELLTLDKSSQIKKITRGTTEFLVRYYLDFFFWLLAYIEADIIDYYKEATGDEDPKGWEEGIFQKMLPSVKDGKYIPPIDSLFNRWRYVVAESILKKEKPLSWKRIAQYLPDPILSSRKANDICSKTTNRNKYRELVSWRSGKVIPSDEKIEGFIENMLPPCSQREWFYWYAKVAIAMNKINSGILNTGVFTQSEIVAFFSDFKQYRSEINNKLCK